MEIINSDNRKPPFIFNGHPEKFNTQYDFDKYWNEEYRRWVEGYSGLTGRHYFYVTCGKLKTITGAGVTPYWRDGDHDVFWEDDESRKYSQDFVIIKRREFGLTSIYGGNEPIYNCLMYPGSTNLLTSADSGRVASMYTEKTLFMLVAQEYPSYQT